MRNCRNREETGRAKFVGPARTSGLAPTRTENSIKTSPARIGSFRGPKSRMTSGSVVSATRRPIAEWTRHCNGAAVDPRERDLAGEVSSRSARTSSYVTHPSHISAGNRNSTRCHFSILLTQAPTGLSYYGLFVLARPILERRLSRSRRRFFPREAPIRKESIRGPGSPKEVRAGIRTPFRARPSASPLRPPITPLAGDDRKTAGKHGFERYHSEKPFGSAPADSGRLSTRRSRRRRG